MGSEMPQCPVQIPLHRLGVVSGHPPLVMSHLPSGHCLTPEISTLQLHWYQQPGLSALWPLCRVSAKKTRMFSPKPSTHFPRWHYPGPITHSFPVSPVGGKENSADDRGFTSIPGVWPDSPCELFLRRPPTRLYKS